MRFRRFTPVVLSVIFSLLVLSIAACTNDSGAGPTPPREGATSTQTQTPTPTTRPTWTPRPTPTPIVQYPIDASEIEAYYELGPGRIDIKWANPADGQYFLSLRTADSDGWNIYFGGHSLESAAVVFREFNLSGTETLVGFFGKSALDGLPVAEYAYFTIDLSTADDPGGSSKPLEPTATPTPTLTLTSTPTPVLTSTSTSTPTPVLTPTSTSTPTPIPTPTPTPAPPVQYPIEGSEIGAYYEVDVGRIDIKWTNPNDGTYTLSLRTADSDGWNIYYGGHEIESASVIFSEVNLSGTETLVGFFGKSALDGLPVAEYGYFTIDLSTADDPGGSSKPLEPTATPTPTVTPSPTPAPTLAPSPTPAPRWTNPTAPNDLTKYLSGDFTDSDGDGMTDVAERKYGYDPMDVSSFPAEPEVPIETPTVQHLIRRAAMGAYYEVSPGRIDIKWTNPENGSYSLRLRTEGSYGWNIYYGGHRTGWAEVEFSEFNLSGTEILVGHFTRYDLAKKVVASFPYFRLDLSEVEFPKTPGVGDPANRLSYTFSGGFPRSAEQEYREFLKRVFPVMYEHLGPPAETFTVHFNPTGTYGDSFEVIDDGRILLSDASFIPRLIVHELVHAWKGRYTITSNEDWDYDASLSGFEEGMADAMAFEIIQEYVRSYPDHSTTLEVLDYRSHQYWGIRTNSYDAIKNVRWTGAGDFWTHTDGPPNRYTISAVTVQMMLRENPDAMKEFMARYYEAIREDPDWRPYRDDIVDMWASVVPEINGYPLGEYLDALPVFNGRSLDEGVYVLEVIRPYGESGDQQFAVSYAIPDGRLEWGVREDELYSVPLWIGRSRGDDGYYYIDTQNSQFTVEITDAHGREQATYNFVTKLDRRSDGTPRSLGWYYADELEMEKFPVGLYRETVTFTDYIEHDEGAREDFYFFGLQNFEQDKRNEYVIMIGVDGVPEGTAEIVIDGVSDTAPIENGAAVFRSREWPFDMQGRFPITITNAESVSQSYYRTLLEAGTLRGYFQHQFIIVDTDFNGVEDQFE